MKHIYLLTTKLAQLLHKLGKKTMRISISHLDGEAIAKKVFFFRLVIENMKLSRVIELLTVATALEVVSNELRQQAAKLAQDGEN